MKGLCSKCKQDWHNCTCDQFHPNVEEGLILSREECNEVIKFIEHDYLNPDLHEGMYKVVQRIKEYLK